VFHVHQTRGQAWSPPVELLIRARACSLPILVMISFFVVARSRLGDPGRTFVRFVGRRFRRAGVPCLVSTAILWTAM